MAEEERGQERGSHEGENLRGEGKAPLERLPLFPWVVSLVHSSNVIAQNSEPEKCCPTNSTIGSLLSILNTKTVKRKNLFTPIFIRLSALNNGIYSYCDNQVEIFNPAQSRIKSGFAPRSEIILKNFENF